MVLWKGVGLLWVLMHVSLKGMYKGQLMSTMGREANNIYPIAMAIVEAEKKDSWTWFLERLLQILALLDMGSLFIKPKTQSSKLI
jgi:hypothetical protein